MKTFWLSILHVFTALLGANAQFVTVYTPLESMTLPGNTPIVADHWEYQQLFDASLFSSIPTGGGSIRNITLRPSPNSKSLYTELTGIAIELSTTTKSVDSLSPVFAENKSSDNFVFWSGENVTFYLNSDAQGNMVWSPSFSVLPGKGFSYNPSKGNLLMTIHNLHLPEGSSATSYDGVRSSLRTASVRADAGMDRGTVSSEGLVVSFAFSDIVPEPSSVTILALGSMVLLGISRQIAGRKDLDVVP